MSKKNKYPKNKMIVAQLEQLKRQLFVASFFSGVGGFDRGARRAGFQSLLQSDWWNIAGQAFELNIDNSGDGKYNHLRSEGIYLAGETLGNIKNMTFEQIQALVKEYLKIHIGVGDLDVMIGGPPCQDQSKCNNFRDILGERNHLIFPYLDMIETAKPKVALIEQVPDILTDPKLAILWRKVRSRLNRMRNYRWNYRVMNAKDYGSRQDRKRLIIMLVRRDLGVPVSFPEPTSPELCKVAVQSLLPHVYHFSPGQYKDGIKSAKDNVFCTMTASGSEYFYGIDGKRYRPFMKDRLVLTELEGLNLEGIPQTAQKKLVGNMVQISFAEALFLHIKTHILKVED
jgi:DNA-cytosine methyltransferase